MEEHSDENAQDHPRWVPYTPPPPDGWDRARLLLRRLSFPFALLLLGVGVAGVFYWNAQMEKKAPPSSTVNVLPSSVTVENGSEQSASKGPSRLAVRSTPSGATVRVNGDSVGVTPFTDSSRQAGAYMLSVQREGHFRTDTVVVLEGAAPTTVRLSLRQRPNYTGPDPDRAQSPSPQTSPTPPTDTRPPPANSAPDQEADPQPERTPAYGSLFVTSQPTDAVVMVEGTERGRAPLPINKVSPGTKQITVTLDGYHDWSSQVSVTADTTTRVQAVLKKKTGRLRVLARPWGSIYIDDTLHARDSDVWYETELPTGRHDVKVVHTVLGEQTRTVTVQPDKDTSIVVDMRSDGDGSP